MSLMWTYGHILRQEGASREEEESFCLGVLPGVTSGVPLAHSMDMPIRCSPPFSKYPHNTAPAGEKALYLAGVDPAARTGHN
jgi:hypothetical protein